MKAKIIKNLVPEEKEWEELVGKTFEVISVEKSGSEIIAYVLKVDDGSLEFFVDEVEIVEE